MAAASGPTHVLIAAAAIRHDARQKVARCCACGYVKSPRETLGLHASAAQLFTSRGASPPSCTTPDQHVSIECEAVALSHKVGLRRYAALGYAHSPAGPRGDARLNCDLAGRPTEPEVL